MNENTCEYIRTYILESHRYEFHIVCLKVSGEHVKLSRHMFMDVGYPIGYVEIPWDGKYRDYEEKKLDKMIRMLHKDYIEWRRRMKGNNTV